MAEAEVYVLEYPDPTGDATGALRRAILNDLVPGLQINRRELKLARERSLRPAERNAPRAAEQPGLDLRRRDLCGLSEPRVCGTGYLVRRAKESEQLQGPRLWLVGYLRGEISPGTLHPNRPRASGHRRSIVPAPCGEKEIGSLGGQGSLSRPLQV